MHLKKRIHRLGGSIGGSSQLSDVSSNKLVVPDPPNFGKTLREHDNEAQKNLNVKFNKKRIPSNVHTSNIRLIL